MGNKEVIAVGDLVEWLSWEDKSDDWICKRYFIALRIVGDHIHVNPHGQYSPNHSSGLILKAKDITEQDLIKYGIESQSKEVPND